jgi:hypothetical protein
MLLEWEEIALLAQSSGDEGGQEKGDASMQDMDEWHTGMDLDAHKKPVSEGSPKHPSKGMMQKFNMER